tara:strand:- start:325 stop:522 length:198 start_codon:yes stop_codon:yes gene_type:complete
MNNSQFKRAQARKHNMKRIEIAAYEMDSNLFPNSNSMLSGNLQTRYKERKALSLVILAAAMGVKL